MDLKEIRNNLTKDSELSSLKWLAIAEQAANSAINKDSLELAELAIDIYEKLDNEYLSESFLLSAMMLRAYMINKHGIEPYHPVLDINKVLDWFKSRIPRDISFSNWKELDIKDILELRKLKNRIQVIKTLRDNKSINLCDEIERLLELSLP